MEFYVLGSGSKGNSFLFINSQQEAIIIDVGFSLVDMEKKLAEINFATKQIKAVLITHCHIDHVAGVKDFCDKFTIPLYATTPTHKFLQQKNNVPKNVINFDTDIDFQIGDFAIKAFATPHDVVYSVGFVIKSDGQKIGFASDLGELTSNSIENLANSDILIIECNYDDDTLMASERPLVLKNRIKGKFGHLSNSKVINALPLLLGENSKILMAIHLSCECNSAELVKKQIGDYLTKNNRNDIKFYIAEQFEVSSRIGC